MNYTDLLYYNIVRRIKSYQDRNGCSGSYMAEVSGMSAGDYSNLIHLKTDVPNRRYLLTKNNIAGLVDEMGTSSETLIWGYEEEQEAFIKLLFVAALTNGSKTTPIQYYQDPKSLFKWALTQTPLTEKLRGYVMTALAVMEKDPSVDINTVGVYPTILSENVPTAPTGSSRTIKSVYNSVSRFFHKEYGFFYSGKNAALFSKLKSKRDPKLDSLANEILNLLMTDFSFAKMYTNKTVAVFHNKAGGSYRERLAEFKKLISGSSTNNRGEMILDWGGANYCIFVYAFNNIWEKYKRDILAYFKKKWFSNKAAEKQGLKAFNESMLHGVMTSPELISIISTQAKMEEFTSDEVFASINYYRFAMYEAIRDQRIRYLSDERLKRALKEKEHLGEDETPQIALEISADEYDELLSKEMIDEILKIIKAYGALLQNHRR